MNEYPITIPEATLKGIGFDAIDGTLKAPTCGLFIADIAVDADTPFSVFEAGKATYTGYVPGAVTWSAVTRADDGSIEYLGACPEFRPTDGVTPNMIRGVYLRNTANDNWLCAARFEEPGKPMEGAEDSIRVTVRYRPGTDSLIAVLS